MKSSHSPAAPFAVFDDANLLGHRGSAPAVRLAERCGLPGPVREKVRLARAGNGAGTAPDAKVTSLARSRVRTASTAPACCGAARTARNRRIRRSTPPFRGVDPGLTAGYLVIARGFEPHGRADVESVSDT